MRKENA